MGQVEADHLFIKGLVDWAGASVRQVALRIGVSPSTLNRHYNGTAETKLGRDTLDKLREMYPDYPGWAERNGPVRSELAAFGDRPFDEKFGRSDLPMIPVLGSALGMKSFDPDKDIELTEVDMGEILDRVQRPASLARDNEAYALTVIGNSMWPRFRPGRRIIVSPRAPVVIGDDVVVQLRPAAGEDLERVSLVLLKELVRRSESYVELRQFNPDITFQVDSSRVVRDARNRLLIHKVIGEVY
jgi:phage repressor protein C with HTH and peptisase S24 domain